MARKKHIKGICEVCGKSFLGWRKSQRFCSHSCCMKVVHKLYEEACKKRRITLECKYCHRKFEVPPAQKNRIFCSLECWRKAHDYHKEKMIGKMAGEKHPNWKGGKVKRNCEICGKEFLVNKSRPKKEGKKYCSRKCYGIARIGKDFSHLKGKKFSLERRKAMSKRVSGKRNPNYGNYRSSSMRTCKICGKKFRVRNSRIKKGEGIYCSKRCEGLEKRKPIREKAWNWKGGISPLYKQIRHLAEYTDWRKAVFERDNYTCQKCGIKSGNGKGIWLEAHHIEEKWKIIKECKITTIEQARLCEELWDINNGITLCIDCHNFTKEGRIK